MFNFKRCAPPLALGLASLLLWVSFAWGLPAEAPAAEGGAEVAPGDPWAGVKISDDYDYAKCPNCGKKNEIRAMSCSRCWRELPRPTAVLEYPPWFWVPGKGYYREPKLWAGVKISDAYDYAKCPECGKKNDVRAVSCSRCGYALPLPSGEYTYPPWVFVPGKGYYREGTVVEPGKARIGHLIAGLGLSGGGALLLGGGAVVLGDGEYDVAGGIGLVVAGIAATATGIVLIVKGFPRRPVYAFASGGLFEPYERPAFALTSADSDNAALKVEMTALGF